MTGAGVIGILIAHLGAFGSGELKKYVCKNFQTRYLKLTYFFVWPSMPVAALTFANSLNQNQDRPHLGQNRFTL